MSQLARLASISLAIIAPAAAASPMRYVTLDLVCVVAVQLPGASGGEDLARRPAPPVCTARRYVLPVAHAWSGAML